MKIQKDPGQVPLTMAGPRERAGLMEQPAGGWTAWGVGQGGQRGQGQGGVVRRGMPGRQAGRRAGGQAGRHSSTGEYPQACFS